MRSAVSRRVARVGDKGTAVTVAFSVDAGGSIGRARILSSTGDAQIDSKVLSAIERASVSEPPQGAETSFQVRIVMQ